MFNISFTFNQSPNVVLKLRASDVTSGRRVQWDQTAVDNEYMNKKKSKCEFHSNFVVLCQNLSRYLLTVVVVGKMWLWL